MPVSPTRIPRDRIAAAALIALLSAVPAGAQDNPVQPVVHGHLATPDVYVVQAGPGDLVSVTLERQGEPATGTVAVNGDKGLTLRKEYFFADDPAPLTFEFVAPRDGAYRIRIQPSGHSNGTYTLRSMVRTPQQQVAGVVPVTPIIRDESTRIRKLTRDVRAGNRKAVERFWAEAKARGGYFTERIPGSDEVLVTFVWKAIYDTRNVFLVWPGDVGQPEAHFMSHVPNTNVWYKSVRLLRGSRFSYELAPNDRGASSHPTAQTDPLNPQLFTDGDRSDAYGSILELPGAPDESWFRRTPAVRGTVTERGFESVLLKGKRNVSVYTPPGYTPSKGPYGLLILFDGPGYLRGSKATNTLDNLLAARRIRPTVVCFVDYAPGGSRLGDLLNPVYADAIATELVPWLRSLYAIDRDRRAVTIGGYSAGAGAAGFIALKHPDVFGNVYLQSGGVSRLLLMPVPPASLPIRVYFDAGLYEEAIWRANAPASLSKLTHVEAAHRLRDTLVANGYRVTYQESAGAHEGVHFRVTLADALIALLGISGQ